MAQPLRGGKETAVALAVIQVVGALGVSFAFGLLVLVISAWEQGRIQKRRLQDVAFALGVPVASLDSDDSLVPRVLEYLSARFSGELLRNRLSDLCGLMRTCWNWLGSLLQIGLTIGVTWAMYTGGRDQGIFMWSVPLAAVLVWLAALAFSLLCLLLTGRYPGEAKASREYLVAFIEKRSPLPQRSALIAAAFALLSAAVSGGALVVVFTAGDKGTSGSPSHGPVPQVRSSDDVVSPEPPLQDTGTTDPMSNSVQGALSAAVGNLPAPEPLFANAESRIEYLRWLGAMSPRLQIRIPELAQRKEFLQTVWYESKRAGLNTSLVLGLIESTSKFHKHFVSEVSARGYMSVAPAWSRKIGDGDTNKLFHTQVNLRFGCVLLRHFLDLHAGDLYLALADYYASNVDPTADAVMGREFVNHVFRNSQHWRYQAGHPAAPLGKGASSVDAGPAGNKSLQVAR